MIHVDRGEVRTHASWKRNKKWENFNSQGTKMSLLSDKLWLIANNSKSFPNGNISILRSNLGLCKLFIQTYLNLALFSSVLNLFGHLLYDHPGPPKLRARSGACAYYMHKIYWVPQNIGQVVKLCCVILFSRYFVVVLFAFIFT